MTALSLSRETCPYSVSSTGSLALSEAPGHRVTYSYFVWGVKDGGPCRDAIENTPGPEHLCGGISLVFNPIDCQ